MKANTWISLSFKTIKSSCFSWFSRPTSEIANDFISGDSTDVKLVLFDKKRKKRKKEEIKPLESNKIGTNLF